MRSLPVRWKKLLADLAAERGRVALMIVAVAASLVGVGAVLGARSILTREIARSYLGTRPPDATLELADGVDPALLAAVRARPEVRDADAREVVLARVEVGDDWRPMLLFVVDDFDALHLATFQRERGAWPPPRGTVLVERSALELIAADEGRTLRVKTPHGDITPLVVSGVVHDPGLAPAWQEREGYGYVTKETLALLGEAPVLHALLVAFRPEVDDAASAERSAQALGAWLVGSGHPVHELRVPPPKKHPHQRQMETVLLLLLVFSALALVLGAVLVAATLASMLARQVREIGVMKAVGAESGQLALMYGALVAALGALAFLLAWPLGLFGARTFALDVAHMLNFDLASLDVGPSVVLVQAAAALLVPLAFAAVPILRATRTSVRDALDHRGVSVDVALDARLARLPLAARNAVRRPARLALTVGLLAGGGAMFMTALAVSRAWEKNLDQVAETRHYDVEVRFGAPEPIAPLTRLAEVPGVVRVEVWGAVHAAFARPDGLDLSRTYPDRSHGSLELLAPPDDLRSIELPLLAGRWLEPGDTDAVVLNHGALAQSGGRRVGDRLTLSLDGVRSEWTLVGVVQEIGSPGAAYVSRRAYDRVTASAGRARMLRVTTAAETPAARAELVRQLDHALAGHSVEAVVPFSELRTAIGDHLGILVRALISLAVIMAIVGLLGLASTMGASVVERTREIGVMKAIGASRRRVLASFVGEGLFIAALGWAVATLVSLPLTAGVEVLIGQLGFLAPLPFVLAPEAIVGWAALLLVAALAATWAPAERAARLTVHEALREP